MQKYLTVEQVADLLSVTPELVRMWIHDGRVRATMLGGRKLGWRIAESEIERLVEAAPSNA